MSVRQQDLLARYNECIARRKARGELLASYLCPGCFGEIECSIPKFGQVYDSIVECPHCEKMHFKVVHHDGLVETRMPPCKKIRQCGFSLVGLLASLLVYVLFIGGIATLANAFMPTPPEAASPRYTVTKYEIRVDGQPVPCTETHDHQTGARERAC